MNVPVRVIRKVKYLLLKMNIASTPFYIPVTPEIWSKPFDCSQNVKRMVELHEGKLITGWAIYESPILIEAIYHGVYQSVTGETIDITSSQYGFEKILFVEDVNSPYIGRTKDNYRINTTDNPIVDDFINLFRLQYRILNYGDRAYNTKIEMPTTELGVIKYIETIKTPLEMFIYNGNYPNARCFCGSDKTYYECHGKDLSEFLTEYNSKYK